MNDVKKLLQNSIDNKYRDFSAALNPDGEHEILGIRLPVLRKIAKELVKKEDIRALNHLSDDSYEEVLLQGMVVAYSRIDEKDKKPYIDHYLEKCGDGWSLVDCFAGSFRIHNKDLWYQWTTEYVHGNDPAKIRFGYVMMMKLLEDQYIDGIIDSVLASEPGRYYTDMAKAWLLATAAIKYGEKVEKLLEDNALDRFTHNKTIQKMTESYRISDQQKQKVRKLKR